MLTSIGRNTPLDFLNYNPPSSLSSNHCLQIMHFTSAVIPSILAISAATTTFAAEPLYRSDSSATGSPQSRGLGLNFKREAHAYPFAYADPYDYGEIYAALDRRTPKFHFGDHGHPEKPKPRPSGGGDTSTRPRDALKKATSLLKALRSGTLKVSESNAAKLAGVGCDVNDIASLFMKDNDVGTDVLTGVSVACSAGKIVKTVAGMKGNPPKSGGKTKRWENYRRVTEAKAEVNAWADAEANREEETMLVARYMHGLE